MDCGVQLEVQDLFGADLHEQGVDYWRMPTATFQECYDRCFGVADCNAFTFNHALKACWLKNLDDNYPAVEYTHTSTY